jgi:hypothetical protein
MGTVTENDPIDRSAREKQLEALDRLRSSILDRLTGARDLGLSKDERERLDKDVTAFNDLLGELFDDKDVGDDERLVKSMAAFDQINGRASYRSRDE